jgi:hypothetical protein
LSSFTIGEPRFCGLQRQQNNLFFIFSKELWHYSKKGSHAKGTLLLIASPSFRTPNNMFCFVYLRDGATDIKRDPSVIFSTS